ncbi:hypothetical protein MKW92_045734 [Papaver armeniacum]|nr:hypothetical protein MKW92_045734 [Papaver armeniacum]
MGRDGDRKRRNYSRSDDDQRIRKKHLAKKAQKNLIKVAKKLKTGYANDSNPFVWKKKIEKSVSQGESIDEISVKSEKRRMKESMVEIEKAQHEEEMAMLARERDRAESQDWQKREEEFHFNQSKIRSGIRLREGRIKPIDRLSKHLDDFEFQIDEPCMVFLGLTVKDIEELRVDIKMHLDLDRATPRRIEYWDALLVVCDWELAEARKTDALARARVRGNQPPPELLAEERGIHSSIEEDVKKLLHGKTYKELQVLLTQIESQMRSGTAKVVEYWEAIVKRLHIFKARACLKEIHTLRKRLQNPKSENILEDVHDDPKTQAEEDIMHDVESYKADEEEDEEAGSFSPELVHDDENEEAIDPDEDRIELERKRQAVKEEHKRREALASKPAPVDDNWELKANKVMGDVVDGDAVFGFIGGMTNTNPRKPKYFNRVHTGYEWNKYNQTHYDHDNPPPKTVQGYKFNIFYPDLVDKTKAPTYTIEKVEGSNGETCLIRFHAGPPYEDIAFKIVNKEWEYSHKKVSSVPLRGNFTCLLQLHAL